MQITFGKFRSKGHCEVMDLILWSKVGSYRERSLCARDSHTLSLIGSNRQRSQATTTRGRFMECLQVRSTCQDHAERGLRFRSPRIRAKCHNTWRMGALPIQTRPLCRPDAKRDLIAALCQAPQGPATGPPFRCLKDETVSVLQVISTPI